MKQIMCSKCGIRPAVIFMTRMDGDKSSHQEGLCLKCAMESQGPIKQMMENMGITEDDYEAMSEQFGAMMGMGDDGEGFEPGGTPTFPFMQGLMKDESNGDFTDVPDTEVKDNSKSRKKGEKKSKKRKYLPLYCTNLTQKAREGKIDRIIGRDNEIYRVIQILCRRSKNNPCLIGEPGVGKTAIAEGLALRIANGDVPAKLANKEIQLLDLTSLVAGTQFRGQFEGRVKGLVEEVKAEGNIILFIDEVHNLVGTGGDSEGSMNAANILKPALSRGEVQIIGATTFTEYRKYIEKDAALERRLQPVTVEEPSIEDTYNMLLGIKDYYENYHKVQISDNLVHSAVTLSERFINDRFLPDKAIDLLDEACTCANLRNKNISEYENKLNEKADLIIREQDLMEAEEPDYEAIAKVKQDIMQCETRINQLIPLVENSPVTEEDLARVIQLWTGIPAQKIVESDLRRLADLDKKLKSKVIGQDEAVDVVSKAVRRGRINVSPRRRPSSFIFVGPTGVGKTELVKQLANELNGAKKFPGKFRQIKGIENLDKVIDIDQSPIGRTPRSNPATYTGVFSDIRELFANTVDAKMKGFNAGRFSFNVKGGRCEACQGDGIVKIEMHFLSDVYVPCDVCKGRRYNNETLAVQYKGKSIYDVLEMTVVEGMNFFENVPRIYKKLKTLYDVGLGYVKIGQPATTLSGGEAQRVKLSTELSKRPKGKTVYILDEPTTGLHTADVHRLIDVLQALVDSGNTVIVIEHNLDVIKTADHIIDLGPEGGEGGGMVIAEGTPEQVAQVENSYTGQYLKRML